MCDTTKSIIWGQEIPLVELFGEVNKKLPILYIFIPCFCKKKKKLLAVYGNPLQNKFWVTVLWKLYVLVPCKWINTTTLIYSSVDPLIVTYQCSWVSLGVWYGREEGEGRGVGGSRNVYCVLMKNSGYVCKTGPPTPEWKYFQIQWGQKFLLAYSFGLHFIIFFISLRFTHKPFRNYTMVGSLVGNLSKIKILCVLNCRKLNRSQMWIVKFKERLDPGHLKNQEQISVWNYSVSVVSFRFDSVTSNEIQSAENQQKEVYLVAGTSHMVPVVMDAEGVLLCWEFTSSPKVLKKCFCLIFVNVNSLFAFSALLYHTWSF